MKVTTGIFCYPGMMFYLVLKIAAGYVAVRLWKTQLWQSCCLGSSIMVCCLPGIAFLTLPTQSPSVGVAIARAVPFSLFIILLLLWFYILVSYPWWIFWHEGTYPVWTNQILCEVPPQKDPSWLLVLGAGTLPFGSLFIELFFIMSSIWMGQAYYVFGFLFMS